MTSDLDHVTCVIGSVQATGNDPSGIYLAIRQKIWKHLSSLTLMKGNCLKQPVWSAPERQCDSCITTITHRCLRQPQMGSACGFACLACRVGQGSAGQDIGVGLCTPFYLICKCIHRLLVHSPSCPSVTASHLVDIIITTGMSRAQDLWHVIALNSFY